MISGERAESKVVRPGTVHFDRSEYYEEEEVSRKNKRRNNNKVRPPKERTFIDTELEEVVALYRATADTEMNEHVIGRCSDSDPTELDMIFK